MVEREEINRKRFAKIHNVLEISLVATAGISIFSGNSDTAIFLSLMISIEALLDAYNSDKLETFRKNKFEIKSLPTRDSELNEEELVLGYFDGELVPVGAVKKEIDLYFNDNR